MRIELGQHFHAEPTEDRHKLYDIYTTNPDLLCEGMGRLWVGSLWKAAVEAWANHTPMSTPQPQPAAEDPRSSS